MDFVLNMDDGVTIVEDNTGLLNVDGYDEYEIIEEYDNYLNVSQEAYRSLNYLYELEDIVSGDGVVIAKETAKIIHRTLKSIAPNNTMPDPNSFNKHNAAIYTTLAKESIIDTITDTGRKIIEWIKEMLRKIKNFFLSLFGRQVLEIKTNNINENIQKTKEASNNPNNQPKKTSEKITTKVSKKSKVSNNNSNKQDKPEQKSTPEKGKRVYPTIMKKSVIAKIFTHVNQFDNYIRGVDVAILEISPNVPEINLIHISDCLSIIDNYITESLNFKEIIEAEQRDILNLLDTINTNIDDYKNESDASLNVKNSYSTLNNETLKKTKAIFEDIDKKMSSNAYYIGDAKCTPEDKEGIDGLNTTTAIGKQAFVTGYFGRSKSQPIPGSFIYMNNHITEPMNKNNWSWPTYGSVLKIHNVLDVYSSIVDNPSINVDEFAANIDNYKERITLISLMIKDITDKCNKLLEASESYTKKASAILDKISGKDSSCVNLNYAAPSVISDLNKIYKDHTTNIHGLLLGPQSSVLMTIKTISNLVLGKSITPDPQEASYAGVIALAGQVHQ